MDSLQLALGIWFGSHDAKVELPNNFAQFFEIGRRVQFILVIKERKQDMAFIADTLKNKYLRKERRVLGFEVLVINEQQAKDKNLVIR